ncbi:MAG: GTP pyrophosphokinase family protein [Ruminococcaceae bacterium]|nr:GTP pyrophosphokinase family protein [Oscillospiraceae bacterium]
MERDTILDHLFDTDHPEDILDRTRPFSELMMHYSSAMLEIQTKLEVLNAEMALHSSRNPFESIKCRLKSPLSIVGKMKRKGLPATVEAIENNIYDIAGVRVICSFPSDIYRLAESLMAQDDIKVFKIKDYIKNPKPNGYRSLHLILEIPIFLSTEKKYVKVEVQFRTIAMDFWASLEHKLKYKKEIGEAEDIAAELKQCADEISCLDNAMQSIRDKIDNI